MKTIKRTKCDELITRLLDDSYKKKRLGKTWSVDEYCEMYPDYRKEIRDAFARDASNEALVDCELLAVRTQPADVEAAWQRISEKIEKAEAARKKLSLIDLFDKIRKLNKSEAALHKKLLRFESHLNGIFLPAHQPAYASHVTVRRVSKHLATKFHPEINGKNIKNIKAFAVDPSQPETPLEFSIHFPDTARWYKNNVLHLALKNLIPVANGTFYFYLEVDRERLDLGELPVFDGMVKVDFDFLSYKYTIHSKKTGK